MESIKNKSIVEPPKKVVKPKFKKINENLRSDEKLDETKINITV